MIEDIEKERMSAFVRKAMIYGIQCHESTNHLYDGRPYSIHLTHVSNVAHQFLYLTPIHWHENILAACWIHDCIEDCRQTYNDVLKATNKEVAEIVFALTNNKGKTRHERADHSYYRGIRAVPEAAFVKLCDRIANVSYSKQSGSRMFEVYRNEHAVFIDQLR